MGKAAKIARNREIKRKQREDRIKAQVAEARHIIDLINRHPNTVCESDGLGIVPSPLVKMACEKFIMENGI